MRSTDIPEPAPTVFAQNTYHSCRPVIAGEAPCYYTWYANVKTLQAVKERGQAYVINRTPSNRRSRSGLGWSCSVPPVAFPETLIFSD